MNLRFTEVLETYGPELIGILASVLTLLSFSFKDIKRVRSFNCIGALIFVLYGLIIDSVSVVLMNLGAICFNAYHLFILPYKSTKEPLGVPSPADNQTTYTVDLPHRLHITAELHTTESTKICKCPACEMWYVQSDIEPHMCSRSRAPMWRPISEYFKGNYDWVLVKMYDEGFECVPCVAEYRQSDGKWHMNNGNDDILPFPVKYFADMQLIPQQYYRYEYNPKWDPKILENQLASYR